MIRATTPIHTYIFEQDPSQFEQILITYSQNNTIVMEKTKEDLNIQEFSTCNNDVKWKASFRLTQKDTKAFKPSKQVHVQVRVLTEYGEALASDIFTFSVSDVLNDEVLS